MITRIHVNSHNLKKNRIDGGDRPVFTAKSHKGNRKGNLVNIQGPSSLVYRPEAPLKSGAVAYILTDAEVTVV